MDLQLTYMPFAVSVLPEQVLSSEGSPFPIGLSYHQSLLYRMA